jgi:hypothetical protein
VEEETNLDVLFRVANLLTKHLGEQHQMIIMNPDQISVLNILDDGFCKKAVDFLVCCPGRLVEGNLTGVIMEKRPEDRVCKVCSLEFSRFAICVRMV